MKLEKDLFQLVSPCITSNGIDCKVQSLKELDKLWKPREEEMSRQLKDTAEKCDALTRNKSKIEETFQSHNALAVFTASGKLNNDLPTRPVNTISEQKLVFSEKKIIDDNKEAFGSILTIPVFKVTETFTSEGNIWKMETFADNSNILCFTGESTIKSFKLKNSKCETTSVAGVDKVNIVDMTKAKDNKLFFTIFRSSEIKCLSTFTPDSKIETFTSISPLYARGIHATLKNILIGFRDNGHPNNVPLKFKKDTPFLILIQVTEKVGLCCDTVMLFTSNKHTTDTLSGYFSHVTLVLKSQQQHLKIKLRSNNNHWLNH
ncbi:unnamed protein product [Mytilus edulis]|uniref:Uncharacterized protein n=1 Tax=Mytilus edulis TaxID=6550 RepID=A0A8S3ULQ0_MYTED|nr:unnamed protein product [Mytilus edulis]